MEGQDPSTGEPEPSNEQLVVEVALAVLEGKGWIEEASDELIDTLKRLYHANPHCQIEVKFTGDVLHDVLAGRPGEILVASFEQECDEHWEREQAERWSCPCGVTFGLYPFSERTVAFYTLADTGLFEQAVTHCLRCTRDLKRVREQHADGQLGVAF